MYQSRQDSRQIVLLCSGLIIPVAERERNQSVVGILATSTELARKVEHEFKMRAPTLIFIK